MIMVIMMDFHDNDDVDDDVEDESKKRKVSRILYWPSLNLPLIGQSLLSSFSSHCWWWWHSWFWWLWWWLSKLKVKIILKILRHIKALYGQCHWKPNLPKKQRHHLCEICYYRTRGGRLFSVLQIMEKKIDLVGFRLGWQMVWLVLGWFLGTLTFWNHKNQFPKMEVKIERKGEKLWKNPERGLLLDWQGLE